MPAAHYRNYRFDVPEADRLASLAGAEQDIRGVKEFCVRLESLIEAKNHDFVLYDALSTAAAISYGRCFKFSKVRERLPTDAINQAPVEHQQTHNFIIALRDKHIAHSENPFEENNVTLQIADHFICSAEVTAVNTAHGRAIGFPFDLPARCRILTDWWLVWLKEEMKNEKKRLIDIARTKPLEELKRNEQGVLAGDTGPHNVGSTRDRP